MIHGYTTSQVCTVSDILQVFGTHADTAGSNTTCLSSTTAAQLQAIPSITPNATGKIETCQPWGLTIAGGEQPYTVVLTALDSSSVTNTSVNSNDYTYINEVSPSELFMGEYTYSVGDAN